jgi:membrane protease YdiL (CAAX protease family)
MELQNFGITAKHAGHSLRHAAIITAIGIAVLAVLGYFIGFKLFSIDWGWLLFYVLISVPLQELFFRGMLQAWLYRFGKTWAIAIASVLYAAIHFQNPLLVLLTLTAGLAWGYSFSIRRNLAGPIASHMVLGTVLFLFVI